MDRYWDYYFGFKGQADYLNPVVVEGAATEVRRAGSYHEYVDDLLTVRRSAGSGKSRREPFCLFLWFYAPHAPFDRPLRMVKISMATRSPIPTSFDEYMYGYPGKPRGVATPRTRSARSSWQRRCRARSRSWSRITTPASSRTTRTSASAAVPRGQRTLDDTAVLWSSDHGFFLGEHRFYDKRLMYEPSIRVPDDDPLSATHQARHYE